MGSFASEKRTFFYNMQRYGVSLSKEEIKQIAITAGMIGFIWSFNKWGDATFDAVSGIQNLFLGAFFGFIALFINQAGQRIGAVYYGYDPVYEYGIIGLLIGFVVTFASRGILIFFLPGAINLRHLSASRLGEFRYYTNDWEWAKIGFLGVMGNLMTAVIFSFFKGNLVVDYFVWMNLYFAWYSLIPAPGNVGLYLFYPHIHFWFFVVGLVLTTSLALFLVHPLLALFLGIVVGVTFMAKMFMKDYGYHEIG